VDVKVEHRLACAWAYVQDRSVSVLDFALARDLSGGKMTASDDLSVGGLGLFQSGEMTLRNDQYVRRGLGTDVFEGEDVFIFVHFLRRNLTANDAAEEAVRIGHGSPAETIALGSWDCQA